MQRWFKVIFSLTLSVVTFVLCELTFRAYDAFANPNDNIDVWVKQTSREVREHPLLGYTYPPGKMISDREQADEFGMPNVPEALQWGKVDVVGIGDSYTQVASRVFFENFKAHGVKYRSLALFGYGPGAYNVLMSEYGQKLRPRFYLYVVYVGNDPGDIRRYENWKASGKSWYEFNQGYFMPIERQGYSWGWRLFLGRAKGFARNMVSRLSPAQYGALKRLVKRDDAETVFEYVLEAKESARAQNTQLFVLIVPRTASDKPALDPIADKLLTLCDGNAVACLDLDGAFADTKARDRFFASDGHWNDTGVQAAWTYAWQRKLGALVQPEELLQTQ